MQEISSVKVGESVTYVDSLRNLRSAIVTAVWSPTCINLVIVSPDETKTDTYGRQIERFTSVMHRSLQGDTTFGCVWF